MASEKLFYILFVINLKFLRDAIRHIARPLVHGCHPDMYSLHVGSASASLFFAPNSYRSLRHIWRAAFKLGSAVRIRTVMIRFRNLDHPADGDKRVIQQCQVAIREL